MLENLDLALVTVSVVLAVMTAKSVEVIQILFRPGTRFMGQQRIVLLLAMHLMMTLCSLEPLT